jgi:hypothetical protein
VRPMWGVRTTFPRPDPDYSISNRAVVDMQGKKEIHSRRYMNLVQIVLEISCATDISDLKSH